MNASDIHIVPDSNLVRVYYRIDGVLQQIYLFAKKFQQALVTRYKIMADMDISNPNIPHDGRINYRSTVSEFDIRASTFPTQLGETVVMRLLVYNKKERYLPLMNFGIRSTTPSLLCTAFNGNRSKQRPASSPRPTGQISSLL